MMGGEGSGILELRNILLLYGNRYEKFRDCLFPRRDCHGLGTGRRSSKLCSEVGAEEASEKCVSEGSEEECRSLEGAA